MGLEAFLAAVEREPSSVGLFSDFDGTLARIVPDPTTVVPTRGVVELIDELAVHLGRVAIVSGRPVQFLQGFFAPEVELSGLYGIEHWSGGRLALDQAAVEWLPVIRETVRDATEEFGEGVVEDKRYSLTLHYRQNPTDAVRARIERWAEERSETVGLEPRVARMSVELHPPIGRSKADAVDSMLGGLTSVAYIGDDVGDRPAFTFVRDLVASGRLESGAAVLVTSEETAPGLRPLATDQAEGPDGVIDTLASILAAARRSYR